MKIILKNPRELFKKCHFSTSIIALVIHISLLIESIVELSSETILRPQLITKNSTFVIHPTLDGMMFATNLKPITRIVFQLYRFIQYADKVRFYITCLVRGKLLLQILSKPIFRIVDNQVRYRTKCFIIILLYNLVLGTFHFLFIADVSNIWQIINELIDLIQANNHYQVIFILNFYVLIISQQLLKRMTDLVKQGTFT